MPQFEFDGQLIETKPGKTIIEAAYDNGLSVPHFCWHPELPVAGNCRMCLVQVGMPAKDREGNFELDENGNLSGYEKVGPKVASLSVRVDPNDPEAGSYGVSGVEMWRIENRTHIVEVLFDSTE